MNKAEPNLSLGNNLTDKQLLEGCLNGNRMAQTALYRQYRRQLFGVCMRYAKSREEAEDMLQEGFVKIYSDLYQYRPTGALGAWMRRVVVNVALQHIRRRKNLFPNVDLEKVAHTYQTDDEVFSKFREKALVNMVQQLPDGYRAVFNLYVVEGYSHQEIGEQLNISASTSKSQLSRAKATLRQMLEKQLA